MNLINFIEKFPDEASCRINFKEIRELEGVKCRKCGHHDHYWLKNIESYECKKCRARMSLRSGTILHANVYKKQTPYKTIPSSLFNPFSYNTINKKA